LYAYAGNQKFRAATSTGGLFASNSNALYAGQHVASRL
jgi:hypothetical protein